MSILEVMRYLMKKYLLLLFYLFIASLNLNLLLKPLNLITGGTQGLALTINYLTKINLSTLVFIINIITLIISYFFLSKNYFKSALISSFIYPFFIKITSYISPIIISNYLIIYTIIAGLVFGITSGMIYKLGFSSGGVTIITLLLNKYTHLKISFLNFLINSLIIASSYFLFGFNKVLYSLLLILIGSLIINWILPRKKDL